MKKLLLLTILLIPSLEATLPKLDGSVKFPSIPSNLDYSERINRIDFHERYRISVFCIAGYAFVEKVSDNSSDTVLTQIMKKSPELSAKAHMTPMSCDEYMNTKPFKK